MKTGALETKKSAYTQNVKAQTKQYKKHKKSKTSGDSHYINKKGEMKHEYGNNQT